MPPSSAASRRPGGKAGGPASRRRRATAGRTWRTCPEKYCAAPSTSHAQRSQRANVRGPNGGGRPGVVRRHVAARQQRGGGEHQELERSLDVRRALREQPRREHVQGVDGRPADEVAPPGRRGEAALERQPGLRGVELRRRAVQHDGQLADAGREALVEPRARVLELREHAVGVGRVAGRVAGDERRRRRLDPGHGAQSAAPSVRRRPAPRWTRRWRRSPPTRGRTPRRTARACPRTGARA